MPSSLCSCCFYACLELSGGEAFTIRSMLGQPVLSTRCKFCRRGANICSVGASNAEIGPSRPREPTDETVEAVDGVYTFFVPLLKFCGLIDAAGTRYPSQRTTAPLDAAGHASRSDTEGRTKKFDAPAERVSRHETKQLLAQRPLARRRHGF